MKTWPEGRPRGKPTLGVSFWHCVWSWSIARTGHSGNCLNQCTQHAWSIDRTWISGGWAEASPTGLAGAKFKSWNPSSQMLSQELVTAERPEVDSRSPVHPSVAGAAETEEQGGSLAAQARSPHLSSWRGGT